MNDPILTSTTFFKPDDTFVKWLGDYADGRCILDIGCGNGHLAKKLHKAGYTKIVGCDPFYNWQPGQDMDGPRIMPMTVESPIMSGIITGSQDKALMVFARPCHSNFVYNALKSRPKGQEALYITVKRNLTLYNDLGPYKHDAEIITHSGTSEDDEVVLRIKPH